MNMSDMKAEVRKKIDSAAKATKAATDTVIDKSKDLAHAAGNKIEAGGKRLKNA
jgi:hypothetical protein